ncbi:ribonuclease HII [Terriglobus sp.]|uniref:ribonuclease HII n=1 Tax=Terriglobus sp. TaxID=1889013 RepID=UPI003B0010B6
MKQRTPVAGKVTARPKAKPGVPAEFRRKRPMVPAGRTKEQMLREAVCSDAPEEALRYRGFASIAGIDEVGRGALFGPVVAAAVILPRRTTRLQRLGLRDSKQLSRAERERLDREVRKAALAFGIGEVNAAGIDRINIYQASRLAMRLAVDALTMAPDHLLIDALRIDHACAQTKIIYGDSLSISIAAASVIAKVHRDAMMRELDIQFPQYGLASHKGYATPEHRAALQEHGPCELHRRSFAPVAKFYGVEALRLALENEERLEEEALREDDALDVILDDAPGEDEICLED